MKYSHNTQKFDMSGIIPDGMEYYFKPDLPDISFEDNSVQYTVTDLRLLNEDAVNILAIIIQETMRKKDIESVTFNVGKVDKESINPIIDIALGFSFKAESKGRNGYMISGCFLVSGVYIDTGEDGTKILEFELMCERAKDIYEYAQSKGTIPDEINLFELVVFIVDRALKRMEIEQAELISEEKIK